MSENPPCIHRVMKKRTLLPQLWLPLLHGPNDHVAYTGIGESVQTRTETVGLDDVERACAAVVGAVDDGTRRETERDSVLVA